MRHTKYITKNPPLRDNLRIPLIKGESETKGSRGIFAFTLVELIVVVTILAILATIGFVSYSSYLTGVRDTNRLAQLVSIHDGLELYRTKKDLPLPDDNVEVQVNGTPIAYQGYAGSNTLETIDFTKGGKDPRDGEYFTYYLTEDRKYFQLMAFLEEESSITSYSPITPSPLRRGLGGGLVNAAEYSERIPTVYGKKLGILTNDSNSPIQELSTTPFNITSATTGYLAHMTDTVTLSGSSLQSINPIASCKRIKQMKGGSSDGIYEINPTGADGTEIKVYCDMTTDGGGWTFFMFYDAAITGADLFETPTGAYLSNRSDSGAHYSLSSDIFSHTEMMVVFDNLNPIKADEENKIVFFQYNQGHSGFNMGPLTCVGLTGYSYKEGIGGGYISGGTNNSCTNVRWYSRDSGNTKYLLAFGGVSVGNGIRWSDDSYGHDGWFYLR